MKTKLRLSCCICKEHLEVEAETGAWHVNNGVTENENTFCPKHCLIIEWVQNQCPGCIGGWTNCDLWKDFAYGKHNLTREDFESIINGKCPKRTNGTLTFSKEEGIQDLDLSETAPKESGLAFAKAIKDYWGMFPERVI